MQEEMTRHEAHGTEVAAIIAEVQSPLEAAAHEADTAIDTRFAALEERVTALEAALQSMKSVDASAAKPQPARRTQAPTARMLAKGEEPAGTAGVDAALASLSLEQRFAVKAGLLRAGLL